MSKLRVGSLFSGIGGLDLGLERAGMKVIWQVEYNSFCQKVLKKHWPSIPLYSDIKTVNFNELEKPDLICGGFPCQPWSTAGHRKGESDERNLWPETLRAIRETNPEWVLLENVPGILAYEYFGNIIGELAQSGYIVEWDCLPAAAFGAPHLRYRLFIVAHSKPNRSGHEVINNQNYLCSSEQWTSTSCGSCVDTWNRQEIPPPEFIRMADGISRRMDGDRIASLGNAVVPQVAEWIGRRIIKVEKYNDSNEIANDRFSAKAMTL